MILPSMDVDSNPTPAEAFPPPNQDQDGNLAFPGALVHGEFTIQYININKMKRPRLIELCKTYQLKSSGNMAVLRGRLAEFSANHSGWDVLKPNARKSHRGPQGGSGRKASTQKKSFQRRDALFTDVSTAPPRGQLAIAAKVVPALGQNDTEHVATLNWVAILASTTLPLADLTKAEHVVNQYPYHDKQTRMELAAARLQRPPMAQIFNTNSSHVVDNTKFQSASTHCTQMAPYHAPSIPHDPSHPSNYVSPTAPNRRPHAFIASASSVGTFFLQSTTPALNPTTMPPTRSVTLGNGVKLRFTEADVPPPPAVSFAADLEGLNSMWDDTTAAWNNYSALNIRGHPIALVYWKEIYASSKTGLWKPGQWKGTKNKWFEWKVIVERYRQVTPSEFWDEFSADGERLGYTAILDRLEIQRVTKNEKLANRAKVEYSDRFESVFGYRKGGLWYVKSKPSDIAKQYRKLKGMDVDSDE